jgi:hypothetical protein
MRSPLRERLATADTPAVEDAVRACLDENGWSADPIGSVSGGSNVVSAKSKGKDAHEQTQVFIHPPDQKPRVTGGPDDEKFWKCLGGKLGAGPADESGGDGGASDKSEKGDKKDPGDKASSGNGGNTGW